MKRLIAILFNFFPAIVVVSWVDPPPSDYWGHVATGKELPWHGRLQADTLNIRAVPRPIFHDWLGKKILASTVGYRRAFKVALLIVTVGLMVFLSAENVLVLLAPVMFVVLYSFSPYLRPLTLTFPIFAAFLLLLRHRMYDSALLLLLFWGQIHLTWILGLILLAMDYYVDRYFVNRHLVNGKSPREHIFFLLRMIIMVLMILWLHPAHFHVFQPLSKIVRLGVIKEWQSPDARSTLGILFDLWCSVGCYS